MFMKSMRTSIWGLINMLFQKSFLKIYAILGMYLILMFCALYKVNFWELDYLKDPARMRLHPQSVLS
jgi:hypothetical protein